MGKRKVVMLKYEGTVEGAVGDAFSIIEELAGEMREAFDNTPESLQNGGVGEARGEAADNLEQISAPDVDKKFSDVPVAFEYPPSKRRQSRADRLADGLRSAYGAIEALEEMKPKDDAKLTEEQDEADQEREALIQEIQGMIDDAEAVTFPGMYG